MDELLPIVLEVGEVNLRCMELLDQANTTTYGTPVPTTVPLTIEKGPFIIITGHDLKDLQLLLEQTKDKGINIYTHGEMLPAHAYPEFKKYSHLKGNFGTAWQNQQKEFDNIPGAILYTTNCLMPVKPSYADRVFTTEVVSYPEMVHIGEEKDFTPVIEKALALGGYTKDQHMTGINGGMQVTTGFSHGTVLSVADQVIEAVKNGDIKHFFLVGGCDGARVGRNYYTEVIDIMANLGFDEIKKPAMLNSVGRIMTIPKGAKAKGISIPVVIAELIKNGFEITGNMPDISSMGSKQFQAKETGNTVLLKDYLKRLGNGEDLESVKKDFVQNFSDVDASEIMKAEQELIKEGTPITEVQKLCDVHSALFHGLTKEEKIANAEKAVEESLKKEETSEMTTMTDAYVRKHELAKALRETKGHPLYSFTEANEKFSKEIADIRGALEKGEDVSKKISDFRQIAIHYAQKGDLIYPLLKVRYEISGPSYVMWTVDDEIRDELAAIDKECNHDEEWIKRVQAVLTRADEMIYKETNILFPICAMNFTAEEWYEIYEDAKDYALVYGIDNRWEEAEKYVQDKKNRHEAAIYEGEIVMGGGHMSAAQLEAMLNTLPIEITFIDDNNINRFFNEGAKVFKRPGMAIDREVFSCHPPKIESMVRSIIESFKNHTRDSVPVWIEKQGKPFLVTYYAVRDKKDNYLGTVEVVQDMQFAKEHFTS